jgi:hypothetical protein
MSTIKSSDEHLTLNADGSSKDIKFQANGVEKASISSAGAFTSTTIDATKLTGALPAISGAALTGVGVSGITSTADSTAITIDSAEQVSISNSNNGNNTVHIKALNATGDEANLRLSGNISGAGMGAGEVAGSLQYFNNTDHIASISGMRDGGNEGQLSFKTRGGSDAAPVEQLKITKDGRGLSQFTAKAWVRVDMSTMGAPDSHNISSITDVATGHARCNFSNAMANSSYNISTSAVAGYIAGHSNINTTSFYLRAGDSNWNQADPDYCMALVFGD